MEATIFRNILNELVDSVPRSRGAVFADWDGEMVDQAARIDETQMSLFAAHWGIVYYQAKARFNKLGLGAPLELLLRFQHEEVLVRSVNDDYYVALSLPPAVNLGRTRLLVERARRRLLEQM